jgi:hypothetical protein
MKTEQNNKTLVFIFRSKKKRYYDKIRKKTKIIKEYKLKQGNKVKER